MGRYRLRRVLQKSGPKAEPGSKTRSEDWLQSQTGPRQFQPWSEDLFDGAYDEFMTGRGQKRLEKRLMMGIGWMCIYLVLYTTVTAVLLGRG